ncbi:MAG: hypothetical protein K8I00_02890, partial [Candidatus Omnitrophica bacterium]|nr:hypothetical protein [Candidatus Omnitrophota bacterium]
SQVRDGCRDDTCLRLTRDVDKGFLAFTAYEQPFDIRTFPHLSFDYKVTPDAKCNLLIKVNDKWYDMDFTDDQNLYWDINMEAAGDVPDVTTDGHWHTASIDLRELMDGRSNEHIIQQIDFVNWDATGFKKLELGRVTNGTEIFVDNFRIYSDQYFWRIPSGHNASSIKHQMNFNNEDNLPAELPEKLKVVFNVPSSLKSPYVLDIELNEGARLLSKSDRPDIYHQGKRLPAEYILNGVNGWQAILPQIDIGTNEIVILNHQGPTPLAALALRDIQPLPWEFAGIPEGSPHIVPARKLTRAVEVPLSKFPHTELSIVYYLEDNNGPRSLELQTKP